MSPLSSGYSLVTMLLATCILHQALSAAQNATLLLVVGGMLTMTLAGKREQGSLRARTRIATLCTPGVGYGLASMLGFGLEFFLQSLATTHYGPFQPLLWSRLCSMALLFLITWRQQDQRMWGRGDLRPLGMIVLIGLFDAYGMLCYSLGTSQGNTSLIAALSSTYPLLPMLVMSHLLVHTLGGCLPSAPANLPTVRRVLDLGCGSGAWAAEYARAHPYQKVLALDQHRAVLKSLTQRTARQQHSNLHYRWVSTLSGPFALSDASVDLVHLQQLDIDRRLWPEVLAECWRLLRPGGRLCLLAWEEPLTNSASWEAITMAAMRAKAWAMIPEQRRGQKRACAFPMGRL